MVPGSIPGEGTNIKQGSPPRKNCKKIETMNDQSGKLIKKKRHEISDPLEKVELESQ